MSKVKNVYDLSQLQAGDWIKRNEEDCSFKNSEYLYPFIVSEIKNNRVYGNIPKLGIFNREIKELDKCRIVKDSEGYINKDGSR